MTAISRDGYMVYVCVCVCVFSLAMWIRNQRLIWSILTHICVAVTLTHHPV